MCIRMSTITAKGRNKSLYKTTLRKTLHFSTTTQQKLKIKKEERIHVLILTKESLKNSS